MRTIRAAVIGAGFIGPAHIEALRRLGFVEVAALVDADLEKAKQKAEALSIPRVYQDYRQMLKDGEIEVVHNCSPNNVHFEINSAILNAGKHCVSEKPLAMTADEARRLVELAKRTKLVNAVDFNYRFYPLVQQAKAMCDAGEVGEVYAVHGSYLQDWLYLPTDYNWRLEPEVSGESRAVADIGSHWCDLVQFVTGRRITEVMADLVTVHKTRKRPKGAIETYAGKLLGPGDYEEVPINTEDYASVLFTLDNGAHGAFTVCQVAAGRKNRLYYEVDGSKCAISGDLEKPNELWVGYREKPNELVIKDPSLLRPEARPYAHYPGGHPEGYPDGPKNLFSNVYRKVMGDPEALPFATFEDGHRAVAIVEAVLKSSRERKWVRV
ncbi:MAG: Gfo/Idh/MocA family protein [Armatimonadota bacterium]